MVPPAPAAQKPQLKTIDVQVPPGAVAGTVLQIQSDGRAINITVPPGYPPGTLLKVSGERNGHARVSKRVCGAGIRAGRNLITRTHVHVRVQVQFPAAPFSTAPAAGGAAADNADTGANAGAGAGTAADNSSEATRTRTSTQPDAPNEIDNDDSCCPYSLTFEQQMMLGSVCLGAVGLLVGVFMLNKFVPLGGWGGRCKGGGGCAGGGGGVRILSLEPSLSL